MWDMDLDSILVSQSLVLTPSLTKQIIRGPPLQSCVIKLHYIEKVRRALWVYGAHDPEICMYPHIYAPQKGARSSCSFSASALSHLWPLVRVYTSHHPAWNPNWHPTG